MKMKKGLLMVVFLLAISSVLAAMSYSSAKVTSAMNGTVSSTTDSLLALNTTAKSHNAVMIDDGNLVIDFSKSTVEKNGTQTRFGLQKNSEYVWDNLFNIKNNSENPVRIDISTEKATPGVQIYVKFVSKDGSDKDTATWQEINNSTLAATFNRMIVNGNRDVSIKVVVNDAELAGFEPQLIVSGTAVN